jgi:hypothetical protein
MFMKISVLVSWLVTLCECAIDTNVLDKHTVSIFRTEPQNTNINTLSSLFLAPDTFLSTLHSITYNSWFITIKIIFTPPDLQCL